MDEKTVAAHTVEKFHRNLSEFKYEDMEVVLNRQ